MKGGKYPLFTPCTRFSFRNLIFHSFMWSFRFFCSTVEQLVDRGPKWKFSSKNEDGWNGPDEDWLEFDWSE